MTVTPAAGQSFVDRAAALGLGDLMAVPDNGHGPGAVFADLNNDTYPDLYLVCDDPTSSSGPYNQVYVNRPGPNGGRVFEGIAAPDGAQMTRRANGAIAGDYDNDGDLDLYVVTFDENVLFQNQWVETGVLGFVDVTATTDPTPGVEDEQLGVGRALELSCDGALRATDKSLTAAWSDVDRDGDLDLYVGTHNGYVNFLDENGNFSFDPDRPPIQTDDPQPGARDTFYRNNGDGTFTDVTTSLTPTVGLTGFETETGAVSTPYQCYGSSNAVIFVDLNLDLWPDLFVTNKTAGPEDRDMLYLNRGADDTGAWQGFEAATYTVPGTCDGVESCFGRMSPAAMGIDAGDPDNDGDFDLYIADISGDPSGLPDPYNFMIFNDLWINQLSETGELSFAHDASMPGRTSWGVQWQDFDNDGDEDLHVSSSFSDSYFHNTDLASAVFADDSEANGVDDPGDGRGNPTADFNRDGWIDILVVHRNLAANPQIPSLLWRNAPRLGQELEHRLSVKLIGDPTAPGPLRSSRDALGARLRVTADLDGDGQITEREVQMREVHSGSSNAATSASLELEVGLGSATTARLDVFWPSGRESVYEVQADVYLWISEKEDAVVLEQPFATFLLFTDGFESGNTSAWLP